MRPRFKVISGVSSFNGKDGDEFGEPKCKGQQTFSVKHQIINILDLEDHTLPVATT